MTLSAQYNEKLAPTSASTTIVRLTTNSFSSCFSGVDVLVVVVVVDVIVVNSSVTIAGVVVACFSRMSLL